jgi:hypothetical protein
MNPKPGAALVLREIEGLSYEETSKIPYRTRAGCAEKASGGPYQSIGGPAGPLSRLAYSAVDKKFPDAPSRLLDYTDKGAPSHALLTPPVRSAQLIVSFPESHTSPNLTSSYPWGTPEEIER